jgi:hypothetical protein
MMAFEPCLADEEPSTRTIVAIAKDFPCAASAEATE